MDWIKRNARNLKTRTKTLLAALAMCAATTTPLATAAASSEVSVSPEVISSQQLNEKRWYFSGTARYYSDIWKEEQSMFFTGSVKAGSRSEALKLARESGQAQAAYRGASSRFTLRTFTDSYYRPFALTGDGAFSITDLSAAKPHNPAT